MSAEKRLQHLVSSDICKAENRERHASELRSIAASIGSEKYFRLRERFFKALGDSVRLKIITMLKAREMCVCEIEVALGLTQPNASHHLNVLEREGIVKRRREGKWVLYRLSTLKIAAILKGKYL